MHSSLAAQECPRIFRSPFVKHMAESGRLENCRNSVQFWFGSAQLTSPNFSKNFSESVCVKHFELSNCGCRFAKFSNSESNLNVLNQHR